MENEYRSPIDGVVDGVHVQPGEAIKANTLLVQVVPA